MYWPLIAQPRIDTVCAEKLSDGRGAVQPKLGAFVRLHSGSGGRTDGGPGTPSSLHLELLPGQAKRAIAVLEKARAFWPEFGNLTLSKAQTKKALRHFG